MNKEKNFVSAVVYVHNNEAQIPMFLTRLNSVLSSHFEKYEIICVNDHSTDQSVDTIKQVVQELDSAVVSMINMSFRQGVELSMNAGVDLAIGDFIFEFDSVCMDYEPDVIMQVYRRSLSGFDIVSAAAAQTPKKSSQLFYAIFNKYSGNEYRLRTESFRILSRRAINRVHALSKTIPYRKALYANCGLKLDTITYQSCGCQAGGDRSSFRNSRKDMAVDILILFTGLAYRASFALAVVMMLFAVLSGAYTCYIFLENQPVAGWTTIMLFLSFAFFGVFTILAIIIKYLAIIVDLIFKKQHYITESVDKLNK